MPVSPTASPPLRAVNPRARGSPAGPVVDLVSVRSDLCRGQNTVEMITAGPLYLENIPELVPKPPPVTGSKRPRSLSESCSDLLQASGPTNSNPQEIFPARHQPTSVIRASKRPK